MTPTPDIIWLDEVDSTNSHLLALAADGARHATVVAAVSQMAGRGQRGNSWEAEPGKNLTFSLLLRPRHVLAADQFAISVAVSLAIVDVLRRHLPRPDDVRVKWPNDIYVADSKICGILIENSLVGNRIGHSIVGVGLNVNQREFLSGAPNPVSIAMLTGAETPLRPLLDEVAQEIVNRFDANDFDGSIAHLLPAYRPLLWRGDGFHSFLLPDGSAFTARIADVAPSGHLTLVTPPPAERTLRFAFKEVIFPLDAPQKPFLG